MKYSELKELLEKRDIKLEKFEIKWFTPSFIIEEGTFIIDDFEIKFILKQKKEMINY